MLKLFKFHLKLIIFINGTKSDPLPNSMVIKSTIELTLVSILKMLLKPTEKYGVSYLLRVELEVMQPECH